MGNPVRVLISGIERVGTEPFFSSGKWRFVERVKWWDEYEDDVPVVMPVQLGMFDMSALYHMA